MDLSKEAQPRSSESNNSAEIDFSEEDDVKVSSTSLPVPSTDQSVAVDNHSSVSLELEANSSEWKLLNVADFSESPPQNKIQRAIPAENVKETVVIDEGKDEAFGRFLLVLHISISRFLNSIKLVARYLYLIT